MSGVVSITDEVAGQMLDQAMRSAAIETHSTNVERPPSTHVFCRKLRLDGPWGSVAFGDIVHRSHPAVAEHEEWFAPTSIGVGLGPGLDEELAARKVRVAELKTRPSRPSAGRAISEHSITPAPHPSTPSTPASKQAYPWSVFLRRSPTRSFTIRLTDSVVRRIVDEVRAFAPDGLETGGYLWGWDRPGLRDVHVVHANGAGLDSRHGPHTLRLAREDAVRAEMPEWLDPDQKLHVVGDVHSHPNGNGEPSSVDLNSWAGRLWKADRSCLFSFASIIVTGGRASGPEFHGWLTRRTRPGHYVCEPCAVVDELGYCD